MKRHWSTILLVVIFFLGLSILLYPTVSDYINSLHQSSAIANYEEALSDLKETDSERLWNAAQAYNSSLANEPGRFSPSETELAGYNGLLDPIGTGVMGYVEIPSIKVRLPIYHGTGEDVLQSGVGHLTGSSLPVGGLGTHCVLSGHRGLPSAKLLTDMDRLTKGEIFYLCVLDYTLAYEIDQILIVEPTVNDELDFEPGQDYCTLVTCTPYGVNTHRLLVRGRRVENTAKASTTVRIPADAVLVDPLLVAPVVGAALLLLLFAVSISGRKARNRPVKQLQKINKTKM